MAKLELSMDLDKYSNQYCDLSTGDIGKDVQTALSRVLHSNAYVETITVSVMHYDDVVGTVTLTNG